MAEVIIGVDPHKLSATIEVVDPPQELLGSGRFSSSLAPGISAVFVLENPMCSRKSTKRLLPRAPD